MIQHAALSMLTDHMLAVLLNILMNSPPLASQFVCSLALTQLLLECRSTQEDLARGCRDCHI